MGIARGIPRSSFPEVRGNKIYPKQKKGNLKLVCLCCDHGLFSVSFFYNMEKNEREKKIKYSSLPLPVLPPPYRSTLIQFYDFALLFGLHIICDLFSWGWSRVLTLGWSKFFFWIGFYIMIEKHLKIDLTRWIR